MDSTKPGTKPNLKKYLKLDGKWQFRPVLKVNGKSRPEAVMIDNEPVKGTAGTFYLEWREDGKRIQKPVGTAPREALHAWNEQNGIASGVIEPPKETETLPSGYGTVAAAADEIAIRRNQQGMLQDNINSLVGELRKLIR